MRRVPELDALRAIAAGVILFFHLRPPTFFYGWSGVDLFFVLSGYLITTIILANRDRPRFVWNFYARRGLRIWPIYYLALIALVATVALVPKPPPLDGLPYYLTYTQNITLYGGRPMPPFHPAFDHTWTLALEEQFYLIWPALVGLACWGYWDRKGPGVAVRLARRFRPADLDSFRSLWSKRPNWLRAIDFRSARLIGLCLTVVLIAWMARKGNYLRVNRYSERILIARCDGFALGGLMAVLLLDADRLARNLGRFRAGFVAVMLAALGWISWGIAESGGIGYLGLPTPPDPAGTILVVSLLYFGVVGSVVCFQGHPALAPLRWRWLGYLGQISYGIYLYHYILYWVFDGFQFRYEDSPWRGALKIAATLAVSAVSWHLIERPILGLKERFRYDDGRTAREPLPVSSNESASLGVSE